LSQNVWNYLLFYLTNDKEMNFILLILK